MRRLFVGIVVLSVVAFSVALARSADDETSDVEIVMSDLPLTAGMQ